MPRSDGKWPLWLFWLSGTIVSGLFAIMCLVTFADLATIQYDQAAGRPASQLNGCMAGTLMSAVIVILLGIVSFMILVRKTWTQSGTGFSYGFLDAAYLFTCFFSLLTGVVLTAHRWQTPTWEKSFNWPVSATNSYVATYVLAFATAVFFFLIFLALIMYRRAVQNKEVTMDEIEARLRSSTASHSSQLAESPAGVPRSGAGRLPQSRSAGDGAWNLT